MKKLITIVTLLILIGCQSSYPRGAEGRAYSLFDVRLGMTEAHIIEIFGDPTVSRATDRR